MSSFRDSASKQSTTWDRPEFQTLVDRTREFVRQEMSSNDPSHDMAHVERVVRMTEKIALEMAHHVDDDNYSGGGVEWTDLQLLTMTLAALLHDVRDFKYSGQENAGADCARQFLEKEMAEAHFTDMEKKQVIEDVVYIVHNVSFSSELDKIGSNESMSHTAGKSGESKVDMRTRMLHCVQDSDRLDALGAIGISRCMAFSGVRNRAFYDPSAPVPSGPPSTKEEYLHMSRDPKMNSAISHFHVKLFNLESMMKTKYGRSVANKRTEYMRQFVEQFEAEWNQER